MSEVSKVRAPAAFALDDPRLVIEPPIEEFSPAEASAPRPLIRERGRRWGSIFLSAVAGLLLLSLFLWVQQTIVSLLARSDWLGWIATVLFVIAGLAFVMILIREISGLTRLSAITALRRKADAALGGDDARAARSVASAIRTAFADRPELGHGVQRLKQHERDIFDGGQVLALTERELLLPLDRAARAAIGASARRISILTSISPAAILAVAFVAYENFRMLRALALIYGGRPGFFSILRLLRLIAGHLAVTGGMALTDDLVQQFIGHGLTARLSRRLGEGLVNGGFTIRIGIAALDVLRPLPYIEARPPRLREFVAEFLRFGQRQDESAKKASAADSV
jgi:putative membrane protein